MKKRLLCVAMSLFLSISAAACGSDKGKDNSYSAERSTEKTARESGKESEFSAAGSSAESSSAESSTGERSSAEDSAGESSSAEDSVTESSSAESSAADSSDNVGTASEKSYNLDDYTEPFVNFDDMHFYINGKKVTLGQTTLQELIDDGVPFDESDIENIENNVKANYQERFEIVLDKYYSALVYVFNDTDSGKKASECYIQEIDLPIRNDKAQDLITFDFPLDLTMEDLAAREPDAEPRHSGDESFYMDKFTYEQKSTKYYNTRHYTFEYTKDVFSRITITYFP